MAQRTNTYDIRSIDIDKKIISSIDNGIIILDDELHIYYLNKWLAIHTGLKEDSVLGKKLDAVFHNIKTKTLTRKIKTALRMKTPTFYTANTSKYLIPIKINQLKISNYEYMQQDVSIIPFDEEKRLVALIITDQTNMANTNALLEANIKKVNELNAELIRDRKTIDNKVLLIKLDSEFMIRDISQAQLRLLGYTKSELLDHNYFLFERLHINKALKEQICQHAKENKVFNFEQKTLTKDGKKLWMSNTLVPEYDSYGKELGYILFRNDITDAKELQKHQEKLLSNSRSSAMGEMVSMIAHQWRQPLSLINTLVATLKIKHELDLLDTQTMYKSLNKMEQTVNYLSETIDDFRNFFKPNKVITEVKLAMIFEKSTALLDDEIKQQSITYIQTIDEEIKISTYQNELIQSIITILKNSVDAFKENPTQKQYITTTVKQERTHLSIFIEDNAGGIKPEILQRIFEPYFSTKSKNGTGLGLYMCKTIIEDHLKGKITVTSQDGTTQTLIELPLSL